MWGSLRAYKSIPSEPFLHWAGGKRQIMDSITRMMPASYNTYYEPFLGGGAVFFSMAPNRAVLNDINYPLVMTYEILRDHRDDLINSLSDMPKTSESAFLKIRSDFNYYLSIIHNLNDDQKVCLAASFIYLTRTYFNGIYSVNAAGKLNTPYNKKDDKIIYNKFQDNFNLLKSSKLLENAILTNVDFEEAVESSNENDFVYFDPPYDPLTDEKDTYGRYSSISFDMSDQRRLLNCFERLRKKGVYVMLSNHNTEAVRNLYSAYNKVVIKVKRLLNSDASLRGEVEELIITSY